MPIFGAEGQNAILLSTLAGLSTGIGGLIAIIKKPDNGLLATLLGVAIGVMSALSILEMFLRNAYEHGLVGISAAVLLGGLSYVLLQPYLPAFEVLHGASQGSKAGIDGNSKSNGNEGVSNSLAKLQGSSATQSPPLRKAGVDKLRAAELMRLGLLMGLVMTLHNLPEGFAVAFSSFTDFGPYMAFAIAIHNIPEQGVIVAAPVYAATGSRWKAMGIALASGLSEPIGALIALVAVKPFISEEPLHYILAFVGGIMLAVCVVELWPEAKKCKDDGKLFQGILGGVIVMSLTLFMGV